MNTLERDVRFFEQAEISIDSKNWYAGWAFFFLDYDSYDFAETTILL